MKKSAILLLSIITLTLCACSSGNSKTAVPKEIEQTAFDDPNAHVLDDTLEPSLEMPYEPTQEASDESLVFNTLDVNDQDKAWKRQLPDGIDAEIQFTDEYTGYVIFYNNSGEDVSLETNITCVDEYYDILGVFGSFGSLVRDGEKYIDIIETRDPIYAYQINCSLGHIRNSVREDNDAIAMTSSKNDDGSVSLQFTSSVDYEIGFFATIFYYDAEGKILGYETSSPQFIYDMGGTFEAPAFEYESYYIQLEI